MEKAETIVRVAIPSDLEYISQDGYLPGEILLRKIDQGEVFILTLADRPMGYLMLDYFWSAIPYISLIWIQKEYRKKGHSRRLLNYVEVHLSQAGHAWLYSSSQADEPEPQAWHLHVGFKQCGVINGINAGDIDEIFFRKSL
jgi:predicted GNAT superfamily acetyltransferase